MGRVFTLPRKQQSLTEPFKAIKDSPPSDFYVIIKDSGTFKIVTRCGNVVQASYPNKTLCFQWLEENDSSMPKEAA